MTAIAQTVAIIGGGPAGMSCALWLKDYGLYPVIINAGNKLGGALLVSAHDNRWVLGQEGCNGITLAKRFGTHIRHRGVETKPRTRLAGITVIRGGFTLELQKKQGMEMLDAAAVVLCTGMSIAGPESFSGIEGFTQAQRHAAVTFGQPSATQVDSLQGVPVAVIGGGDNAFEAAIALADSGAQVTLIMRAREPRAQQKLQRAMAEREKSEIVHVLRSASITGFKGQEHYAELQLSTGQKVKAAHIFALLGYRADTGWIVHQLPGLAVDYRGFVKVDAGMRTSVAKFYAAGDVAAPDAASVVSAMAAGSVAARSIERDLQEASHG